MFFCVEFVPATFPKQDDDGQHKHCRLVWTTICHMATRSLRSQPCECCSSSLECSSCQLGGLLSVTVTPYTPPKQEHVNVISTTSNGPPFDDLGLISVTATPYTPPNQEHVKTAMSKSIKCSFSSFPHYTSLAIPPPQPPQQ